MRRLSLGSFHDGVDLYDDDEHRAMGDYILFVLTTWLMAIALAFDGAHGGMCLLLTDTDRGWRLIGWLFGSLMMMLV